MALSAESWRVPTLGPRIRSKKSCVPAEEYPIPAAFQGPYGMRYPEPFVVHKELGNLL